MARDYNFQEIERKWHQKWNELHTYKVTEDEEKKKFYVLNMFPYPSGAGLHVGHPLGYIASDIAYIVNDSAMVAAFTRTIISKELILTSITNTRPSVRTDSIKHYDEIKKKMEDTNRRNISDHTKIVTW